MRCNTDLWCIFRLLQDFFWITSLQFSPSSILAQFGEGNYSKAIVFNTLLNYDQPWPTICMKYKLKYET